MSIPKYDYLVVGAGLFGSVFAYEMTKAGKSCAIIDRRGHIGGNVYTEDTDGIQVHKYGAHIFHTNNADIWSYVNRFAEFTQYAHSPVANYKGEIYNLPFNMNTFNKLWGVTTPCEAMKIIDRQRAESGILEPKNLEEQAIFLVGREICEKLIKGYTEKQWGTCCENLPAFIIKRLPLRFIYDDNYFNDRYQGIPIGGYTQIFNKLTARCDAFLNTDFRDFYKARPNAAGKIVYTGQIDEFYNYRYGALRYRSLRFETKRINSENYQGCAVMNYTDGETPYTRIIEHKHFERVSTPTTVITKEYPGEWSPGQEPYYPVNDEENNALFEKYKALAAKNVIFGGRLGDYKYYDMDKVIERALAASNNEKRKEGFCNDGGQG